jgi:predicted glycogen debranching enzyme
MDTGFTRKEIITHPSLKLLNTSGTGSMMRAAAWWGRLESRYDAIIAASLNPNLPENRWMLLARYRIWAVYQDHSVELSLECLEKFSFDYHLGGKWLFHIPTSEGKYYAIELYLKFHPEDNHATLMISRQSSKKSPGMFLPDSKKVSIIIRPDIEDRSFHDIVKAWTGPENAWPHAITPCEGGFVFAPCANRKLSVGISRGQFVFEPQWQYMVHHPLEATRGLESESDLFSPGYFKAGIRGLESFSLEAVVNKDISFSSDLPPVFKKKWSFKEALNNSLDAFIVRRDQDKSIIAGYPWFLDWGRDSLIFCRSLIQLGRFSDAKAILRLFGRFEKNGTLPNMICGHDAANRETSDAPLWFIACVRELIEAEKNGAFLDEILDQRSVRQILLSIGHFLLNGTPTGVIADPATCLLYSPSHFTWMDTNFPAGSPRQGYPVEIQALWHYALEFFMRIDDMENQESWKQKTGLVKAAVLKYYYQESRGYFSDCLHSDGPSGADHAIADDALRPNQLFLITLGVITDHDIMRHCVETCMALLVPGGIRSLSNRKVSCPLPVKLDGKLLNDPDHPYIGRYEGDEDQRRKPAYHNGTAWTWPFPVFCEAWAVVFGPKSHRTARSWLSSAIVLMRQGAAGFIPEILDGDMPHTSRGCDAQAWGSSEFARVMHLLSIKETSKEEK